MPQDFKTVPQLSTSGERRRKERRERRRKERREGGGRGGEEGGEERREERKEGREHTKLTTLCTHSHKCPWGLCTGVCCLLFRVQLGVLETIKLNTEYVHDIPHSADHNCGLVRCHGD